MRLLWNDLKQQHKKNQHHVINVYFIYLQYIFFISFLFFPEEASSDPSACHLVVHSLLVAFFLFVLFIFLRHADPGILRITTCMAGSTGKHYKPAPYIYWFLGILLFFFVFMNISLNRTRKPAGRLVGRQLAGSSRRVSGIYSTWWL